MTLHGIRATGLELVRLIELLPTEDNDKPEDLVCAGGMGMDYGQDDP